MIAIGFPKPPVVKRAFPSGTESISDVPRGLTDSSVELERLAALEDQRHETAMAAPPVVS